MPAPVNPLARPSAKHGLNRWIPGLALLREYRLGWLGRDIAAGLVLTAILVPVGMAYAEASGLPGIYGLYATMIPLIVYAALGPNRILILGPDSALAGIIAATIVPIAGGVPDRAVALAGMLAILSGTLCIVAGLARLGFVTDLLSKPIRYGYLNGIALTVLVGQLPLVLGFPAAGSTLVARAGNIARGVADGRVNWTAFAIGAACLAVILGCRRFVPRVPGVLVAVVGATVVSLLADLAARAGLVVVGPAPRGLPAFHVPVVSWDEGMALVAGAVAVALVAFADTSVLSRTFALRGGYEVDPNQELVALGAAHVAAGLFQGFSVSGSTSRTPVAEAAGARTQLTGLVGAASIAALLIFAPATLASLPYAALGAVVIAACLSLFEVRNVARLYRLRRVEFVFSIACFLGVALVGVVQGIFLAVAVALAAFVWRAWRPYDAVLGRVDGLEGYHDISRHPEARLIPGLVLFRWDAPLFFANANIFHEHVHRAVASSPTPVNWVVVAAEPVTDIDVTAADAVAALDRELETAGVQLSFAEMKGPVKDHLKRYGLFSQFGAENFFRTVEEAVVRYLERHPDARRDWEAGGTP